MATSADSDSATGQSNIRWLPLESNPDVMTSYLHGLGVPRHWSVCDVLGLDPDLLAMVPRPVLAVLLLYPLSDKAVAASLQQEKQIESEGQHVSPDVIFMKQTIGNACGTVALVHSIANNTDSLSLGDGPLSRFIDSLRSLSVDQRAAAMCQFDELSAAHESACQQGQTEAPAREIKLDTHFIAFVHSGGHLYELDGRRPFPVNHGPTSPDTLLEDAAVVVRGFMQRDPDQVNFSVLALAGSN